MAYVISTI